MNMKQVIKILGVTTRPVKTIRLQECNPNRHSIHI